MHHAPVVDHAPWLETPLPTYPALDRDISVDVVVVGAGLTGVTAAYLLRNEGVRVALIDRARVARADTARSTAHLTYVTDSRIRELAERFGKETAAAVWQAGAAAIDEIERIVRATRADCDFKRVSGYLHQATRRPAAGELDRLQEDAALAAESGLDAMYVVDVPYAHRAGVRFEHQARFDPRRYLAALLPTIPGDGSHVFEHTQFEELLQGPMVVRANGYSIRCEYLIIATHSPLLEGRGLLGSTTHHSRLTLFTSYVLGARLPKHAAPEALFWDTADPYEYLRIDDRADHQYAIFGGEDVEAGHEADAREVFARLEARLREVLPSASLQHRWMGRVVVTDDGLPFIGESCDREFVATGFCGNGFTLGTLSAQMARDRYLRRANAWFKLFKVERGGDPAVRRVRVSR